jgi:2-methylcitrate dehydratase PrpD
MLDEAREPYLLALARWVANLRFEDIPPSAIRAAKLQIGNMTAAALGASHLQESQAICRALRRLSPAPGRCTVLGSADRLSPTDAVLANAAASMAQDFDDIIWTGHTCHSAVFAPWAVAEHEQKSGRDFLTAVVAANEIAGRLGASSFFGPLNGQMVTFIHLIGAAAGTARLLELDEAQTAHALAISLAHPQFPLQPAFMASSSKLLSAALPAATGIQAAYFAREGVTGHLGILEDERGFWRRFSFLPMPFMLEELGSFWAIETLTIKTYPGCHYFQTACSAIERIVGKVGALSPSEIRSVEVDTTQLACEVTRFGAEYAWRSPALTPVTINFDLRATLAVLLLAGRLTGDEVEEGWLARNREAVFALCEKIRVRHDPALTLRVFESARALPTGRKALGALKLGQVLRLRGTYNQEYRTRLGTGREAWSWIRALATREKSPSEISPRQGSAVPLYFPSRVTIRLNDGRSWTEQVNLPVGAFCTEGVERELRAKFEREVARCTGPGAAREALDRILALDTGNLEQIATSLRPSSISV